MLAVGVKIEIRHALAAALCNLCAAEHRFPIRAMHHKILPTGLTSWVDEKACSSKGIPDMVTGP